MPCTIHHDGDHAAIMTSITRLHAVKHGSRVLNYRRKGANRNPLRLLVYGSQTRGVVDWLVSVVPGVFDVMNIHDALRVYYQHGDEETCISLSARLRGYTSPTCRHLCSPAPSTIAPDSG